MPVANEPTYAELEAEVARLRDALRVVLAHVEDENITRINNQCTLCYTHRALIRAAIANAEGR